MTKKVDDKKTSKGTIYVDRFKEDIPKMKPMKEIADQYITPFILTNSVNTIKNIVLFLSMLLPPMKTNYKRTRTNFCIKYLPLYLLNW
jgi:hypothetical protein